MTFRKEPFFYGHDNYDQLVKLEKEKILSKMLQLQLIDPMGIGTYCVPCLSFRSMICALRMPKKWSRTMTVYGLCLLSPIKKCYCLLQFFFTRMTVSYKLIC